MMPKEIYHTHGFLYLTSRNIEDIPRIAVLVECVPKVHHRVGPRARPGRLTMCAPMCASEKHRLFSASLVHIPEFQVKGVCSFCSALPIKRDRSF
jgi:hypothetical protein